MLIEKAQLENAAGNDARDAQRLDDAEAAYRRAIALAPEFEAAWFNLGVILKWQARWTEARACVERCLELQPEGNEGATWNLGIVATALEDWSTARRAWTRYGIDIPDGEGPIHMRLGQTPIRMKVEENEVVWCERIDPARAIVRNIPMPASGRRYGDLLLHDGAPNGYRKLGDREAPVFDELALIAPSTMHTYSVPVRAPSMKAITELVRELDAAGTPAEDWTSSVRRLCKACSEGRPGDKHEHANDPSEWRSDRTLGVAAESASAIVSTLGQWARGRGVRRLVGRWARSFGSPECVVQGAPAA
jgi:tetratricopeptide (TPR) repeat protein